VAIAATLEAAGFETWCVGGALRDALIDGQPEDVDLATAAHPEEIRKLFRHTVPIGLKFGTVGVLDRHRRLHEVTTFRRDVKTDGRHAVVEYGVSLEEDLARRDFTINALAYHPEKEIWQDPFGGMADLERGLIRAVGDPPTRFREDYLRVLRGLRFAARFGFTIDPATWDAARAAAAGLDRLSAERVRDEWFKSLLTAQSLERLTALWRDSGAAAMWLPELRSPYPLAAESPPERDPVLLTAALLTDAPAVLTRLKASNAEIARARRILGARARPEGLDRTAVRRWMASLEPATVDDLATIVRLETGAPPPWQPVVEQIRSRGDAIARADLALSGDDLKQLGVPSGPELGRTLGLLLDRVLERPELNTRDGLVALLRVEGRIG
jgi:tRNA nucleotidyltransferase (CCA-adding enzyme)